LQETLVLVPDNEQRLRKAFDDLLEVVKEAKESEELNAARAMLKEAADSKWGAKLQLEVV